VDFFTHVAEGFIAEFVAGGAVLYVGYKIVENKLHLRDARHVAKRQKKRDGSRVQPYLG
jgi:hypothetical protein